MSSVQALLNPAPSIPPSPNPFPTPQREDYFNSPHSSNSSSSSENGSSSPVPPVSPRRVLAAKELDPGALQLDGYADALPTSPSVASEHDDEDMDDEEVEGDGYVPVVPSSPPTPSPPRAVKKEDSGPKKKTVGKAPLPKKKGIARPQKKKRKVVEEGIETFTELQPPPKQKQKTVTPIPQSPPPQSQKYDDDGQELYCICRKPDSGKWMIGCDGCEDWFHGECINVAEEDGDLIDKYYCPHCTSLSLGQTTWKRKCRLPACRRPAAVTGPKPSKYCTPTHGILFFTQQTSVASSPLSRESTATIIDSVPNVASLKRLGERIPTPPLSSEALSDYPEELRQLEAIAAERELLAEKQELLAKRLRYIILTQDRARRVLEELKSDPDARKGLKEVCGYDDRLSFDDYEWAEFFDSEEGKAVLNAGWIPGRENVCLKRKCEKHARWYGLFVEEAQVQERLLVERGKELRSEERKIRERQKRRGVRDGREGTVEVEV